MPLIRMPRRASKFPTYTPFSTLNFAEELPTTIRKFFDDAFELAPMTQTVGFVPATEIIETPDELLLTAELPGMTKQDVQIEVEDGVLTLKGEKMEEKKEANEERKYHAWERTYGAFERAFTLPLAVDAAKVNAEFANGVLKVHMPKTIEAKAKGRRIEIAESK